MACLFLWGSLICSLFPATALLAQQKSEPRTPITIQTTGLPKGYPQQPYGCQLQAVGGTAPFTWEITRGQLPKGITLTREGMISGHPRETGEFHFEVTVKDSGSPQYQRSKDFVLTIVAPLFAEWSRYPSVVGQKVDGAIKVSNQTEQDFDLTVIILAVAENGRATAIGYQHFTLAKETLGMEIPFAEVLPQGAYQINVDAVAEVASVNAIYRARLVTAKKIQIQQGP